MRTLASLMLVLSIPLIASGQAPSPTAAPTSRKAIVGGTVVNLDSGSTIADAVVIIEGDRIKAVGPATTTPVPPGAQVIKANGRWILPGLMNLHVHLGLVLPGAVGAELAGESEAALALRMAANARHALDSGVTTVRLVGEAYHADLGLKASIDRGESEGPRIFTAGRLVLVTGGHGDSRDTETFDGPAEFRKGVRQEIQAGVDWIKIAISGGISDRRGEIGAAHMTKDEMEAVTDIAHRHGIKVAAHSGSPLATEEAVDAGIDSIEHGYFLTPEVLRKMKDKGVWLVPTIVVSRPATKPFYVMLGSPGWYLDRVDAVGKRHWAALQTAIKEGVRIALGTDQLPSEPNDGTTATVREAEYYVEAGMTPLQALRAATSDAATLLGVADRLGTIEPGKLADLVVVSADPVQDIRALRTLGLVIKGGQVIRDDWQVSTRPAAPSGPR